MDKNYHRIIDFVDQIVTSIGSRDPEERERVYRDIIYLLVTKKPFESNEINPVLQQHLINWLGKVYDMAPPYLLDKNQEIVF